MISSQNSTLSQKINLLSGSNKHISMVFLFYFCNIFIQLYILHKYIYMTFSDIQSFIKFSCHASFQGYTEGCSPPPNQRVNQEREEDTGSRKQEGEKTGFSGRNLIQDRGKGFPDRWQTEDTKVIAVCVKVRSNQTSLQQSQPQSQERFFRRH